MRPRDPVDHACDLLEGAVAARAAGKPRAAVRAARRALGLFERAEGPRSGDVANVLTELSAIEQDLGRFDAALRAASRAWDIVRASRSREPVVLRLRANAVGRLAAAQVALGRYALGRRSALRALALAERLEPTDVLAAAMSLGVACKHAGRFEEAERAYARARHLLGRARSIELATLLHNLGGLAHARGRFAEGVKHALRGLELREGLLGRHHPEVAADLAALAALLDGCDRAREARLAYRRAARIYRATFGDGHVEVGFVATNLAALEHRLGHRAEAQRLYVQGLATLTRALGRDHLYVAMATHNLGLLHVERGDRPQGLELLRRAVASATRSLGPTHPDRVALGESLRQVSEGDQDARASRRG